MVKQIAGFVARRVVCYASQGEQALQGDDIGFLKFGSRVDLFLPLDTKVLVKMHEEVQGNRTLIARFNN
jgi:phosphatidylserine decarboxylase